MTRDSPGGGPPPGGRLSPRKAPAQPAGSQAQHDEHKRELEALRAELDGERLRSQESRRRFAAEARELREAAERDRQLLADQLRSKWEQQRARELHQLRELSLREREAEIRQLIRWKDAELRQAQELLQRERDAAIRQARDLQRQLAEELVSRGYSSARGGSAGLSSECRGKLQEVLSKLRWEIDGDQAARIRHLRAELELERSLFLKYILERFEGEQPPAGSPHRTRHGPRPRLSKRLLEGPRPRSLESLVAAASPDGAAARSRSLESSLAKAESSLEGSPPQSPCHGQQGALKASEEDAHPQEGAAKDLPMKPTSKEVSLECLDSPPEGKMENWGSAGEGGTQLVLQQQEWLSGNSYSQLVKQNMNLLSALEDLEQRCTVLKEENALLRRNSFPEMQEKVKRLKRKNAELAIIAKRLEERARKIPESNLKEVNAPIPLSFKGSSVEQCKNAFARQRAKDLSEQASILLAKDKQIEALQRECWELRAKLATGKEGSCWLNLSDFDRLLRESQKEVLRLQRQITLKNLKESLQSSRIGPDSSSASTMCLMQEALAPNIDASVNASSLPKQTPAESITLAKDIKPVVLYLGSVSEEHEKVPLNTDLDSKHQIQHLEIELSKKIKQCENLEQEVEKKQKRCEELEMQLKEVLMENARMAEENAQLSGKTKWTEKVESENSDLKVKLMVVTEERNAAVQLTKGLQTKVEELEHVLKDLTEMAERRQQLEVDHEETLLALQKKDEEVKYLEQAQREAKRDHEEVVQLLEAQVRELENQYHGQTEHFNLLSQELERLQIKNADLMTSELPHSVCCSSEDCHALQCSKNINDFVVSPPVSKKQTKKLEFQINSSKSESTQNSPKSYPTPDRDSASEMDEGETGKFALILDPERQGPAKLQVFLARYSYDPFDGPNKNPEAELPLTAGEYVYIYGDMDEDGFFEGELMDGRRGLVPSNLIEEVSDDDLMTFVPPKTSDLSCTLDHEMNVLIRSASSGEKSEDEELSVRFLPNRLEGDMDMPDDHTSVPYPRNLTLIKQFARSVVVSWEPPLMPACWGDVQSYNIYVDTELCHNVRSGSQTQAAIENLDLKIKAYRISVQSVTEEGNSDKKQCTILVGQGFHRAPTCLKLRSITATSAEITWLPSNSNYTHALYLNEKEYDVTEAGVYWYTFHNLQPNTQYKARVEAWPQKIVWDLPEKQWEQKSAIIKFITPSAGPPDAPLDVQVQPGPSADILVISWIPVTIDAAGSSNGVRVTGYAVYVNDQRVSEVMSPTAGSAIVELSQLEMLEGSQKVSVRTVSLAGESLDSVPALIPSAMLNVPSCSSPSNSMSASLNPGLPYGEFTDSQHVKIPLTHWRSSPSSEMCMASQENKFTIPFTSNCEDSVVSLPASIPSPQLFSQSPSLIYELTLCNTGDDIARDKNDKYLKSYNQTEVSVQSAGFVFPSRRYEESVNSSMSELKELAEDSQRKKIKNLFVTKKAVLENQMDTSKMKMSMVSQYVYSDDKSVKDTATPDNEGYNERCLSSVPQLCSQLELEDNSYRNIGIHDTCVQEIPHVPTEKKQMKELSKEDPSLGMSRSEIKADQKSRTGDWPLNPVVDRSHSSELSDILEEEEEDLDLDVQEENRLKMAGNDYRLPELPEFPMQWAQNRNTSNTSTVGQAGKSSLSKAGPLRGFVSEEMVNDNSVRVFVALFDYDPISMSPNVDAAEEELPFKKGQILMVVGDKDADGFYRGECAGRVGYIPYNMVSEVQVESNEMKQHLLKQDFITDEKSVVDVMEVDTQNNSKSLTEHSLRNSKAEQLPSKAMVAVVDYNPGENLNADVESELAFHAGDIITVFGSMDDDGFYHGEFNGQRGLISSDFLKAITQDEE
ncbi:RIMS-binding protein 2-like [Carettochelys insculpta]|uniref:RIMS-binding protein 2-like n=1 Tax=Carettochelys insculpta TaxID=44489 RepID=UPI003EBDF3B8